MPSIHKLQAQIDKKTMIAIGFFLLLNNFQRHVLIFSIANDAVRLYMMQKLKLPQYKKGVYNVANHTFRKMRKIYINQMIFKISLNPYFLFFSYFSPYLQHLPQKSSLQSIFSIISFNKNNSKIKVNLQHRPRIS